MASLTTNAAKPEPRDSAILGADGSSPCGDNKIADATNSPPMIGPDGRYEVRGWTCRGQGSNRKNLVYDTIDDERFFDSYGIESFPSCKDRFAMLGIRRLPGDKRK